MRKIFFALFFISVNALAQTPPRKAIMGLLAKPAANGILADSIIANGTFAALALQKGDVITAINGNALASMEDYGKNVTNIRTGEKLAIQFIRNGKSMNVSGNAVMRPYEQSDITDVQYDWVKFRNGYLRAITRKPKSKTNLPAILLIPGYGCGSIENYMGSYNGKLLTEWLKAGYAVVTIEKSGLGDSYNCAPCSEVDLATDIESFDAGYNYMEQLSFVDKSRLYIWGHSMGGLIAPEVAKRHKPKGVMVFGTTFRPWSEFLLEMHRVQKPLLENQTYPQTEDFIRKIQKIYYGFFVLKKTREDLFQDPEYKDLVVSELGLKAGSNDMWGRHWAFWPQIDSLNLAKSWQQINCPVLVLHGAADYESCSIVEPTLITETVNEVHPGNATMVVVPELDHFMMKSTNYKEARDNFKKQQYAKGNFNTRIADETINWLKNH
ncbi:MAG: alpha/beta fold hydrolase [Chitinophagaceae bacterium]|nr:alpha/beta fold hydrolase [Chitinophagaceae bacterium]